MKISNNIFIIVVFIRACPTNPILHLTEHARGIHNILTSQHSG